MAILSALSFGPCILGNALDLNFSWKPFLTLILFASGKTENLQNQQVLAPFVKPFLRCLLGIWKFGSGFQWCRLGKKKGLRDMSIYSVAIEFKKLLRSRMKAKSRTLRTVDL